MSLVNDMLNDLEQRKVQQPSRQENLEWLTAQSPVAKKQAKAIYWVVALLLVAVALLAYQQFFAVAVKASGQQLQAAVENEQPVMPVEGEAEERSGKTKPAVNNAKNSQAKNVLTESLSTKNVSAENIDAEVVSAEKQQAKRPKITVAQNPRPADDTAQKRVSSGAVESKVSRESKKTALVSKSALKKKSLAIAPSVKRVNAPTLAQIDSAKYKAAKRLLVSGDVVNAEKTLITFLSDNAKAVKSNELLLELLLSQGRLDEAGSRLQSLYDLIKTSSDIRRLQAHYYVLSNKPEQAVTLLLSQQPDLKSETKYYELLALAAQKARQYAVSIKVYKSLLGFDSGQGDWWVGLAISEELYGLKANARANFLQATRTGRIAPALRDYANQRHRALAGAVNVYPQTTEQRSHGG